MSGTFDTRPQGAPYDPRRADGFQTKKLVADGAQANATIGLLTQAECARVNVADDEADEWAITTYVQFEGKDRAVQYDPAYLIGTVVFGHGDMQTGERCEFDWRNGLSLRVAGSAVRVECRYETVARANPPPVALVGATIVRGGSPARGEITRTVLERFLHDGANNPIVNEIPRRAQTTRLVCKNPLDYGRFLLQFWEEPTGTTPVLRWIPLSPSDEVPVPFGATDFSIDVIAGNIDADVQFVLEL